MANRHDLIAPHNPDPIIVTRSLIKRAWSDFEPKVVSGLMSGTVSAGLLEALSAYGVHLPSVVSAGLPVACYFLASYLTPSVGTVTTVRTGDGLVVEKHSGNTEIRTGTIPIQPQRDAGPNSASASPGYPYADSGVPRGTYVPPSPVPDPPSDPEPQETPDQASSQAFTQVLSEEPVATSSRWWPASANVDEH